MTVHVTPANLWAGATSAFATPLEAGLGRRAIGFDLDDAGLEAMLKAMVAGRLDLVEADGEIAAVTITDRPADPRDTGARLEVGGAAGTRNAIDSRDPSLILAAATLVAAGYAVERREPQRLSPLSQRETQVALLLVDGASNKVIARALDISVHTAKFHVTAILEKLGARNRADAVSILLREGLLATA